jgi:hypothetical protein
MTALARFPLSALLLPLLVELVLLSSPSRAHGISPSYWCPGQCHLSNAALCHNNYLFVIGTGRSGSTSIFKALNLVPGVHLCGETGVIPAFRDLFQAVTGRGGGDSAQKQKGASHRQQMALLEDQQRLFSMLHPVSPQQVSPPPLLLGSKEVHIPLDAMDFLLTLFPCSRVVFSYRLDLVAQGNSGFHKKDNTSLHLLAAERQKMLEAHERLGPVRTHLLPLEDLHPEHLSALLAWMGFEDCAVAQMGHFNFNNTYRKVKARPRVQGSCRHRGGWT